MAHLYSDCYFCGGEVQERFIHREIWWQGNLVLIENAPVGVCGQCGEKFVAPDVAKSIDRILAAQAIPDQIVQIPKYVYREAQAT